MLCFEMPCGKVRHDTDVSNYIVQSVWKSETLVNPKCNISKHCYQSDVTTGWKMDEVFFIVVSSKVWWGIALHHLRCVLDCTDPYKSMSMLNRCQSFTQCKFNMHWDPRQPFLFIRVLPSAIFWMGYVNSVWGTGCHRYACPQVHTHLIVGVGNVTAVKTCEGWIGVEFVLYICILQVLIFGSNIIYTPFLYQNCCLC